MTHVAFTKVRGPHGWLSNMSRHPVTWCGAEYRTVEHLFQCWRFVGTIRRWPSADGRMVDPDGLLYDSAIDVTKCPGFVAAVCDVRAQVSPMGAKMRAKALSDVAVVVPRSPTDVEFMAQCLRLKVKHHPDLVPLLLATGDAPIHEDVTARPRGASADFWGVRWSGTEWTGGDQLGALWVALRHELRTAVADAVRAVTCGQRR